MTTRTDWGALLPHAANIVRSYDTGVTLRQLFYRLVADGTLVNTNQQYKSLSSYTAKARRAGWFPDLVDLGRSIQRPLSFEGPEQARDWLKSRYRRDRTEGQEVALYLGVEKATLTALVYSWFGNLGFPVVTLRGYSSQTYVDDVFRDTTGDGRKAILIYAGDHDPSGEDIERDFDKRSGAFDEIRRIAVLPEQIAQYGLNPAPGKASDARAAGFIAKHGRLIQVEVEALDPNDLQQLIADAIADYWDSSQYDAVMAQEQQERDSL